MRKLLSSTLLLAAILGPIAACTDEAEGDDPNVEGQDDKADATTAPHVSDDQLNGIWKVTSDSTPTVIYSWPSIGITLQYGTKTVQLTRTGDVLTSGTDVNLTVKPNKGGIKDDTFDGTLFGKTVHITRDTGVKPSITLTFPGNTPYRMWLQNTVMPQAQLDREGFKHLDNTSLYNFLSRCELYKHGSWFRSYMKGTSWTEQSKSFSNIIYAMNGQYTTPHAIVGNYYFQNAVKNNLSDPSKIGLALSSLGMYFSTAGGGALRLPMASDSTAYFITDRPARAELLGLVVMDTPSHGPLASTFGRQLLDMGAMPATDDALYAKSIMELMSKSSNATIASMSGTGKSAITDWFAVMAIEDYRGVAFGNPNLGWGYNMTNVQFYGLIVRALAHPTMMDSAGNPIIGQVVVGSSLQPGDPSYADVLNGGNDMQEYPDMAKLKQLTTKFLIAKHPDLVNAVYAAYSTIIPKEQADFRAQQDIFHYITAQFYSTTKTSAITSTVADNGIRAVTALFAVLKTDQANFEAFLLANGLTKSNTPAPKSMGF